VARPDCSLLDQPTVLRFMFYPRPDFPRGKSDNLDVLFSVAPDVRVGGRLHVAKNDSPVIVLFHGNGEIASDYDDIALLYTQIGASLLVVDYRGYGKSDGTPTASDLLDDAVATYHQLHGILSERGLTYSRLFIMGRSLGSAAALEIASHTGDGIAGLIIESGFASALGLVERLGGSLPDHLKAGADGFNNARKIERLNIPTLIIHGEADEIIPVGNGRTLYEKSGTRQKRLVIIPDAGHNDLLFRGHELYFDAIREFVYGRPLSTAEMGSP
jgi:alpha-beta hydrolase superfamily lysophospholipase